MWKFKISDLESAKIISIVIAARMHIVHVVAVEGSDFVLCRRPCTQLLCMWVASFAHLLLHVLICHDVLKLRASMHPNVTMHVWAARRPKLKSKPVLEWLPSSSWHNVCHHEPNMQLDPNSLQGRDDVWVVKKHLQRATSASRQTGSRMLTCSGGSKSGSPRA